MNRARNLSSKVSLDEGLLFLQQYPFTIDLVIDRQSNRILFVFYLFFQLISQVLINMSACKCRVVLTFCQVYIDFKYERSSLRKGAHGDVCAGFPRILSLLAVFNTPSRLTAAVPRIFGISGFRPLPSLCLCIACPLFA